MIANGFTDADRSNGVNSVEILDIETKMTCDPFANVPLGFRGGAGGLIDQSVPLVCSGKPTQSSRRCFLYKNGAWGITGLLLSSRDDFSFVPNSPFGNTTHKFYVVGGDSSRTGEVFDGQTFQEAGPLLPYELYLSCLVYLNATTVMLIAGKRGFAPGGSSSTLLMNSKMSAWQQGPSINVARFAHGCGRIAQGAASDKYSTIIVAGKNGNLLKQVEFLDDGATSWRNGPDLPVATQGAPVVEDQRGGIIYVGGDRDIPGPFSSIIYRLRHAGAQWETLASKITTPRVWHSAFLVPDELVSCQPI